MMSRETDAEIMRTIDGFMEINELTSLKQTVAYDNTEEGRKSFARDTLFVMIDTIIKYVLALPMPSEEVIAENKILKFENTRLVAENAELRNGICALYEKLERY
jgi:hypothetical protein